MNDEITIYDHAPLDDAVDTPDYFGQPLVRHFSAKGIAVSSVREVNPGTPTQPTVVELTIPAGNFSKVDNATKDFLNASFIPHQREEFNAGANTIRYTFPRPTSA